MDKLHRQFNTEDNALLAPSEVENSIRLCSNSLSLISTSLGGKTQNEIETEIAKKLSVILFDKYVLWKQKQKILFNMEELAHQNN